MFRKVKFLLKKQIEYHLYLNQIEWYSYNLKCGLGVQILLMPLYICQCIKKAEHIILFYLRNNNTKMKLNRIWDNRMKSKKQLFLQIPVHDAGSLLHSWAVRFTCYKPTTNHSVFEMLLNKSPALRVLTLSSYASVQKKGPQIMEKNMSRTKHSHCLNRFHTGTLNNCSYMSQDIKLVYDSQPLYSIHQWITPSVCSSHKALIH